MRNHGKSARFATGQVGLPDFYDLDFKCVLTIPFVLLSLYKLLTNEMCCSNPCSPVQYVMLDSQACACCCRFSAMHMHPVVRFRCGMRHMPWAGDDGVQFMRRRWNGCAHHSKVNIAKVQPAPALPASMNAHP